MHELFSLFPSAGALGVIFLPYKLHLGEINTFSCILPSLSCIRVFMLLSLNITCFCLDFILVYWYHHLGILLPLLIVHCIHPHFCRLLRHSWWWILLVQFGLGLWWRCHLGHFNCLIGTHLSPLGHIPLLWCFYTLLIFRWFHQCPSIHGFTLSHCLQFGVSRMLGIWLGSLEYTQKSGTP